MILSEIVKNRIAELLEITLDVNSRKTEQIYARLIFVKFYSDMGFTTTRIGEMINKDHATVIYSRKVFEKEYLSGGYFKAIYDEFKRVPLFDTIYKSE